jgi:DNA gyrase/topoisomerase IV subunit B
MSNEQFKILSARDHVRSRVGMYMGSSSKEQVERFVLGKWTSVVYVPALLKMIDEVIDNSIDEAIRTSFRHANKIDVTIVGNCVTVSDNGRGIPQDLVVTPEGEKIARPVAAWTRVNSGTSFDASRTTIGTNGVGSSATNFLSSEFVGRTWSNNKQLTILCEDGCSSVTVSTNRKTGSGTQVSFVPDFSLFDVESIGQLDTIALVNDRLTSLQLAFPEIQFSFNGTKIDVTDLRKYAALFVDDGSSTIIEKTDNVSMFFAASVDGFRTNSFVNGVNTRQGGVYVDYVVNNAVDELVAMIKKKHKIDVVKSTIKNGLTFVLFVRNFADPKFDSQTKERLTSTLGSVRDHYASSAARDFKALAKRIFAAEDIIQPIIAAQLAKKQSDESRAAFAAQKKLTKVKVAKHIAATSDQATLFLTEGQSASGPCIKVRDPKMHGMYPLQGVVMNTWDLKPVDVLKNKELSELVAVLGLNINDPNSINNMNYKTVAVLVDADHDGTGHIFPLLVAFFYKFWPKLFQLGKVQMIRTPIMIASKGKDVKWFYTYTDAEQFKAKQSGYNIRYIKGLGSLQEGEYATILNEPVIDVISVDDPQLFEMMFGNDTAGRKLFMMGEAG